MQKSGDQVGEYVLERRLGKGNFGEVWLATPLRKSLLYPQVALKFAYPGKAKLAEVEREALVWQAASGHANVVAIVDAWVEGDANDGYAIIASEYAPDGTLKEWLARPHRPAESCRLVDGILSGLKHLHTRPQPVIHRDLKPGNVLLKDGVPKLADFGMSRIYRDGGTILAGGTPQYMAPENFERQYSAASDVWAAGVLLYRMLTGKLPFPLPPETPDFMVFATMYTMLREQPPQPAPQIAAPLRAVLERALAKDPTQRPSAYKMRAALRKAALEAYGIALHRAADHERTVDENEWDLAERAQQLREESARQQREAEQRAVEESGKRRAAEDEAHRHAQEAQAAAQRASEEAARRRKAEEELTRLRAQLAAQQNEAQAQAERVRQEKVRQEERAKLQAAQASVARPAPVASKIVMPKAYRAQLPGGVGLEMGLIGPGRFQMGSPDYEEGHQSNEKQHWVTISKPFYMGIYPVTQAQWEAVMRSNPSNFKNCAECPVESVSWNDAQEFIQKLNAQARDGGKYRLPSEAEWEYACRAGTETVFGYGNDLSSEQANFDGNYPHGKAAKGKYLGKTTRVGSYAPNGWGLYDMHGNVWEWCQDWYDGSYPDAATADKAVVDPSGPTNGSSRVIRGGSWHCKAVPCRSARRSNYTPVNRNRGLGFRLSRTPL